MVSDPFLHPLSPNPSPSYHLSPFPSPFLAPQSSLSIYPLHVFYSYPSGPLPHFTPLPCNSPFFSSLNMFLLRNFNYLVYVPIIPSFLTVPPFSPLSTYPRHPLFSLSFSPFPHIKFLLPTSTSPLTSPPLLPCPQFHPFSFSHLTLFSFPTIPLSPSRSVLLPLPLASPLLPSLTPFIYPDKKN